jgi:tRNA-splicing ligase RtcB
MFIKKEQLQKINDYLWEIPMNVQSDMQVPARIYASEAMLEKLFEDRTLEQLLNVSTMPGILKVTLAMPDAHEGYGFPIGGVAAFKYPDGVISPGGIGYDINCGVRLVKTELEYNDIKDKLDKLIHDLSRGIPKGVGRGGKLKLDKNALNKVLTGGSRWAIEQGYGEKEDLAHTESSGRLDVARSEVVSERAKKRGFDQLGTMGAGNHFVEIDRVDSIFDKNKAMVFGLRQNQIVILIHSGSRGLGHQVATDYIRLMMSAMPKYNISVPDRELVCVPLKSREGKAYFSAMAASANYAWANRQLIMHGARKAWSSVLGRSGGSLSLLYDVAHNIAKIEEHDVDNKKEKVIMHRKGATRAFGPGHDELAEEYREVGQPVIIPGSMGTASYVLVGTEKAMQSTFGSTCHGAGRAMSRKAAMKNVQGEKLKNELKSKGIRIEAGSLKGLVEEAPQAYKDIEAVIQVVDKAGIATKVARVRPLAVIKG